MREIQDAINATRARCGADIGVRVKQGRAQVVRVKFGARGKSQVVPVTQWVPVGQIIPALDAVKEGA